MKKLLTFAALFTLATAHELHGHHARFARDHLRRQGPAGSPSAPGTNSTPSPPPVATSSAVTSTGSPPSPAPSTATPAAPAPSTAVGAPPASPTQTVPGQTVTASTGNGTATRTTSTRSRITTTPLGPGTDIPPLESIVSDADPEATASLTATYAAGQQPPYDGAVPLPTPFVFSPTEWPAQDRIPDTNSPEVQEWLRELDGFHIPDLAPTVDGTCVGDPAAAADAANRGWWTCGGYTRTTDVVTCPDKQTWGMSFDDGPAAYTQKLLNYLNSRNLHATFFVVGSRVIERPNVLVEEYMSGHEISVHTWSHNSLTRLTTEQIVAELGWTRRAIQRVLGVTPVTMRPPYGDIDDRVRAISLAMGMVPVIWSRGPSGNSFDTNDWKVPAGVVTGPESFQQFQYILNNASQMETGFIVLQHDLFQQTVDIAVGYTLDAALAYQPPLNIEPIGTCQGWPTSNMYLETTTNTTFPYLNSSSSNSATTTAAARADAVTASAAAAGNGGQSLSMTVPALSSLFALGLVLAGGLLAA